MSDNLRGALLMCAAMAALTCGDVAIKATGGAMPLSQLLVIRGIFASSALLVMARYLNALRLDLPKSDWLLMAVRGLAEALAAFFFLTALLSMPIANATALMQMLPLTVTLGGAVVFREAVGWRRWTAIVIGFFGMLLIVRPGTEGFSGSSVYVLCAVAAVTVRDLVTRRMSSAASSLTVTFVSSVIVTLFAGVWSVGQDWVALTPRLTFLVMTASIFIIFAYLAGVAVMRVGQVSFVAPFRYTGLIWALILGFVLFGEWPEPLTLIGAAIIVATGVFSLLREARFRRKVRKPALPRQP
ncbi:DMT family transporter [Marivita sp. GX14005]|uniref:DMT family transporter n=1 Tax=Marivita sp. GX14005 TaxID=2942276 RepID=UPI002018CE42|nr:DMT family transporter [Marivita sp. GX14005]MCL3882247.1 DMT family transporter [Marivita sp. GX14005]